MASPFNAVSPPKMLPKVSSLILERLKSTVVLVVTVFVSMPALVSLVLKSLYVVAVVPVAI